MEIVADLHMHSTCSDGKYPPAIIVEKVIKAGLEVFHPAHSKTQIQYYLNYANKNNLLVTGGSDYHGWDNKISVGSFGIDENYLNNFTELLN